MLVDPLSRDALFHRGGRIRIVLDQPGVKFALENIQFGLRRSNLVIDCGELLPPIRFVLLAEFAVWVR